MPTIFEQFASKEDLLKTVEEAISEQDGVFTLNDALDVKAKFDKKTKDYATCLNEKIQAQNDLRKTKDELETLQIEVKSKERGPSAGDKLTNDELQELTQLRKDKMTWDSDKNKLTETITALTGERDVLKTRELDNRMVTALDELCTKFKLRPEAQRDVRRLRSELQVDATGEIVSKEGKPLDMFFEVELKNSPHWLPGSASGGATGSNGGNPGATGGEAMRTELHKQSLGLINTKSHDPTAAIAASILTSPRKDRSDFVAGGEQKNPG